jgi:plastocyanin
MLHLAAAVLALIAAACAGESPAPPTPTEPVVAKPTQTVAGKAPRASGSFPSIVVLEPRAPVKVPVPTQPAVMNQLGRTFIPNLLLIRAGQAVEFRNSEHEPHNVHVVETATGTTLLNVGMLIGVFHRYAFDRPGTYSVQCDLHPEMFADIVVTTTPYVATTDRDGKLVVSDVPLGAYDLIVRYGDKVIRRPVEIDGSVSELIVEER